MKFFQLTKSFRLMRLLNWTPKGPARGALAAVSSGLTLIFTGSKTLAAETWRCLYTDRNMKLGMRRLAWYARKSRFGPDLVPDPVFDFSEKMTADECNAQRRFLSKNRDNAIDRSLDELTLLATETPLPLPMHQWQAQMAQFEASTNTLLAELAALPHITYQPEGKPRKGDFAVDAAAEALAAFAALFPIKDVPWYIISGTFLGVVREGGFLPHDYDIDLGINAEIMDLDAISEALNASPEFELVKADHQRRLTTNGNTVEEETLPILLKMVHASGVHIDLFVHWLDGNIRWHGSNVHRWENVEFELVPYTLAGTDVLGPDDHDTYLIENYGDWKTPKTSFSPSTGTPNLRMVNNLASLVLFLRRYALSCHEDTASARHIAEIMIQGGYLNETGGQLRFVPTSFTPS